MVDAQLASFRSDAAMREENAERRYLESLQSLALLEQEKRLYLASRILTAASKAKDSNFAKFAFFLWVVATKVSFTHRKASPEASFVLLEENSFSKATPKMSKSPSKKRQLASQENSPPIHCNKLTQVFAPKPRVIPPNEGTSNEELKSVVISNPAVTPPVPILQARDRALQPITGQVSSYSPPAAIRMPTVPAPSQPPSGNVTVSTRPSGAEDSLTSVGTRPMVPKRSFSHGTSIATSHMRDGRSCSPPILRTMSREVGIVAPTSFAYDASHLSETGAVSTPGVPSVHLPDFLLATRRHPPSSPTHGTLIQSVPSPLPTSRGPQIVGLPGTGKAQVGNVAPTPTPRMFSTGAAPTIVWQTNTTSAPTRSMQPTTYPGPPSRQVQASPSYRPLPVQQRAGVPAGVTGYNSQPQTMAQMVPSPGQPHPMYPRMIRMT
jgi:hypothetical protein